MKHKQWKPYLLGILIPELVGGAAGLLTREGTRLYSETLIKPPLSPPAIVFPIAWVILYGLMGVGSARVFLTPESDARTRSLTLYGIQLAFNFFWSIIFFNFQNYGFALIWILALWGLIFWMACSFKAVDTPAALLQIPYLIWVAFATYLNFGVWQLNG